jgi:translation initiation factor 1
MWSRSRWWSNVKNIQIGHWRKTVFSRILDAMTQNNSKTVWSSEIGDLRKQDDKPTVAHSLPPQQQTIYLHRESKGRGGKAVTLIKGLMLSEGDLSALAKKLKQACGSGGTVKDGVIEIQGEHREKIADTLQKLGFKVKVAGG